MSKAVLVVFTIAGFFCALFGLFSWFGESGMHSYSSFMTLELGLLLSAVSLGLLEIVTTIERQTEVIEAQSEVILVEQDDPEPRAPRGRPDFEAPTNPQLGG